MTLFKLDFEVRDSELDMQGIVNNANYFTYLEHARHKFLKQIGVSFSEMTAEKQLLVLISTSIEFRKSLRSEDKFYVTCNMVPEGKIRIGFEQEIRRIDDDALIVKSYNVGACIDANNRNRPYIPDIFKPYLEIKK